MSYIFLIPIILFFLFLIYDKEIFEGWQDYSQYPYNYILSGRDPLYFYHKDRYRKPYEDGFTFYQSYPVPHMEPLP